MCFGDMEKSISTITDYIGSLTKVNSVGIKTQNSEEFNISCSIFVPVAQSLNPQSQIVYSAVGVFWRNALLITELLTTTGFPICLSKKDQIINTTYWLTDFRTGQATCRINLPLTGYMKNIQLNTSVLTTVKMTVTYTVNASAVIDGNRAEQCPNPH